MKQARRLPAILLALTATLAIATLVLTLLDPARSFQLARSGSGGLLDLAFLLPAAAFSLVGALIAARRPGNAVSWLCLAIGLLWTFVASSSALTSELRAHGLDGAAEWASAPTFLWVPALGLIGTHLPLRLPDGRLLSPTWRWYSRLCSAVIVVAALLIASEPGGPVVLESLRPFAPLFALVPLSFVGAIASLVIRYRRARADARQQIRWIAFGAVAFLAAYLFLLGTLIVFDVSDTSSLGIVLTTLGVTTFAFIPASIGIAILRYRLYDIDVVINRTLVYGSLSALLAGAYLGSVLLLQSALAPLTEGSGLAVALSTLAVAALFRPARNRIQALVDRRFYRRKYDAERTLERFAARLRDEVDLDALRAELTGVVAETMQPAHVSLWLREAGR